MNPLSWISIILSDVIFADTEGVPSLKQTASLQLKRDGWNTSLSYWVSAYFQVRTVSFREGIIAAEF